MKIAAAAKLPLSICKGSPLVRAQKAEAMVESFYNEIKSQFNNREISIEKIQNIIDNLLPGKSVTICEAPILTPPALIPCYSMNKKTKQIQSLNSFKIRLPVNRYSKLASAQDVNIHIHEISHLFTYMHNPKYGTPCGFKANFVEKAFEFYGSKIYEKTPVENLNKDITKYLKPLDAKRKISMLQRFRYNIKNEIEAYRLGHRFTKLICKEAPELFPNLHPEATNPKIFNFEEKLKVIETKLAEIISQERKAHAQRLDSVI